MGVWALGHCSCCPASVGPQSNDRAKREVRCSDKKSAELFRNDHASAWLFIPLCAVSAAVAQVLHLMSLVSLQ